MSVVLTRPGLRYALTPVATAYLRPRTRGVDRRLPTISVDDRTRYQRLAGFGGAMTDSSAWLIYNELAPRSRNRVLEDLFSPQSGIDIRFVRVPLGASDFTITGQPYTYDDLRPGASDPTLAHFSISHDLAYIIPSLRAALSINQRLELLATPWTPPPWMKTNHSYGNFPDRGWLDPVDYGIYARYLVKALLAYAANGIRIDALTVQNEPSSTTFPGLELPWEGEAALVNSALAPNLRASGLRAVRIYGVDDGFGQLGYAERLLGSPAAADLSGIAWHCYGGMNNLDQLRAFAPRTDQIVSECSPGIIPYSPAEAIIDAARHWASSVALWNLALDPAGGPVRRPNGSCQGCTGLVTVSESSHTFRLSLGYYELGQVSRYVRPGAVRIASTRLTHDFADGPGYGVAPGIDDLAVRNPDGSLALVVHNNGAASAFRIAWRGRSLAYRLGAGATATFIWR